MRRGLMVCAAALVLVAAALVSQFGVAIADEAGGMKAEKTAGMQEPFGGKADVMFGGMLWKAMDGYQNWLVKSDYFKGVSPHGSVNRIYWNVLTVEGKPYNVIVKENYDGNGATVESVAATPDKYLKAITVMVQRETGYDSEDNDWFYVRYDPDGTIPMANKMAMAGRVAKGMESGCLPCHKKAGGDDYIFTNDGMMK